jgi:predicted dithiol-disulfide oxidoreductase (DUF899 family)
MSKQAPQIVRREQWNEARRELMQQEKQLMRLQDELSEKRRALPRVRVEQAYTFDTPEGTRSLADLFGDKTQLLVYHLMFAPEWEAACKSCSWWAEGFSAQTAHLAARDVSFCAISRAPVAKLQAYAKRMGWSFPWVSSGHSTFNYDFCVSFSAEQVAAGAKLYNVGTRAALSTEQPGFSVFFKDEEGAIFQTYGCYARGIEPMNAGYQYLDLLPKGRDEAGKGMAWLRRHDEYGR